MKKPLSIVFKIPISIKPIMKVNFIENTLNTLLWCLKCVWFFFPIQWLYTIYNRIVYSMRSTPSLFPPHSSDCSLKTIQFSQSINCQLIVIMLYCNALYNVILAHHTDFVANAVMNLYFFLLSSIGVPYINNFI